MRRLLLLVLVLALPGCATAPGTPPADAYAWKKSEEVRETVVTKVESPLAPQFCAAILGRQAAGCAVRLWGMGRCVIVIRPNDAIVAAHEAGGHCMGYDH